VQTDGVEGGAGGDAGGEGKSGGGEGDTRLRTQSEQSDPYSHTLYSAPGPPSSHSLSNA